MTATEPALIAAQAPDVVHNILINDAKNLGQTADNKVIYLYQSAVETPLLLEIGRLRELTFRAVGEGSLKSCDLSDYDFYYDHLILFDETAKVIVGSYRLIECRRALALNKPLYTESLFHLSEDFKQRYFPQAVEMGRSFIQPDYWGSKSLDYLWYGIAAYFLQCDGMRYFLGAISISNDYPEHAKELLVHFYSQEFPGDANKAQAKTAFKSSQQTIENWDKLVANDKAKTYEQRFALLKACLKHDGLAVPTLYKQYTQMYYPDGVKLFAFTVNTAFDNAIDGLIVTDTERVLPKKRERYSKGLNKLT